MDLRARRALAQKRLESILARHIVATSRTLENKIADAGPYNQRIDPHHLTGARKEMIEQGRVVQIIRQNVRWFHLPEAPPEKVEERLAAQAPFHQAMQSWTFTSRAGQALEIAVFRALCSQRRLLHFGHYRDLDAHDDSTLYSKEEPPSAINGRDISPLSLDYVVNDPDGGLAGIEVKNVRQWMYPGRVEVTELLKKCCRLDIVPVLIARRIPFVTFKLMNMCGVIVHQTYNQRFPNADATLATQVKDKNLLGYHDVRVGNEPDGRLVKFIHENLPKILPDMRARFDRYGDLLQGFAEGEHSYASFAARVGRRSRGEPEDFPEPEPEDYC